MASRDRELLLQTLLTEFRYIQCSNRMHSELTEGGDLACSDVKKRTIQSHLGSRLADKRDLTTKPEILIAMHILKYVSL